MIYQKPTYKAIHICNSHEPTLNQKLQKSMSFQHTNIEFGTKKYWLQQRV